MVRFQGILKNTLLFLMAFSVSTLSIEYRHWVTVNTDDLHINFMTSLRFSNRYLMCKNGYSVSVLVKVTYVFLIFIIFRGDFANVFSSNPRAVYNRVHSVMLFYPKLTLYSLWFSQYHIARMSCHVQCATLKRFPIYKGKQTHILSFLCWTGLVVVNTLINSSDSFLHDLKKGT